MNTHSLMLTPSLRSAWKFLPVVAVAVALSGCGGEASSAGQVISAGDVTVLVAEHTGGGMDALGGGQLEVVGGCLGANGYVIVWPPGTKVVEGEPLTVEIPGEGTYALGDEVQLGGGYVLEHSSDAVDPGPYEVGGVTVPAECAEHDIFLSRSGN